MDSKSSKNIVINIATKIYDFFPKTLTFWSVLFYIYFAYLLAFIIFNIYFYIYDLEYEIDCIRNDRCFIVKKRGENISKDTNEKQPHDKGTKDKQL